MEEIVESTLALLSVRPDPSHLVSLKILDPVYFFALVDTKAVWFQKWMVRELGPWAVLWQLVWDCAQPSFPELSGVWVGACAAGSVTLSPLWGDWRGDLDFPALDWWVMSPGSEW